MKFKIISGTLLHSKNLSVGDIGFVHCAIDKNYVMFVKADNGAVGKVPYSNLKAIID